MKTFLSLVTDRLSEIYNGNYSELTVVFPGKRARMFMDKNLFKKAGKPVWAPRYTTIDELFLRLSDYKPCEPIHALCELYKTYTECCQEDGTEEVDNLDEFFSWGEVMLNDFNDIDKHMIDAHALFSLGIDEAKMERIDFLGEQQREAINTFFSSYIGKEEKRSKMQRRFLETWKRLPKMYDKLNQSLRSEKLLYKGAIYRDVAERLREKEMVKKLQTLGKHFAFVGFNVLDPVEEKLFEAIQNNCTAYFFWDYDKAYLEHNEAGIFLKRNLQKFPSELKDCYDNLLSTNKQITYLATGTDNAMVRYLPTWIAEQAQDETQAAIILCDETLMTSVLHAIPTGNELGAVQSVNITMGYPLRETPIYGYLSVLLDLQVDGYNKKTNVFRTHALEKVTHNPLWNNEKDALSIVYCADNRALLSWLSQEMQELTQRLAKEKQEDIYTQLYTEAGFQVYRALNQFIEMCDTGLLDITSNTLRRLLKQAMNSISIPFHGEMDEGLQVMGLLEARNLDFRNLILLSVGEGYLPKRNNDTSFIPYSLKKAFDITTEERKIAVYAYYFYRTIQRAEHITFMYNDNSSGNTQHEPSRFLRQLLAETNLKITQKRLSPTIEISRRESIRVRKTPEVIAKMEETFVEGKHALSPSALSCYLSCPLQFYFQHVAGMSAPIDTEEGIDPRLFGTLFHDSAEIFYTHLASKKGGNKDVLPHDLASFVTGNRLTTYVELAFWVDFFHAREYDGYTMSKARKEFLKPFYEYDDQQFEKEIKKLYGQDHRSSFNGTELIIKNVITEYLTRLLRWDHMYAPFRIVALEQSVGTTIEVDGKQINIGGRIDRMDQKGDTIRIVDYKTGTPQAERVDWGSVFKEGKSKMGHYYLQTFLYSDIISKKNPDKKIKPCLFYITQSHQGEKYDPTLVFKIEKEKFPIEDFRELSETYNEGLHALVKNIFDPTIDFTQTEDKENICKYCDFCKLCGMSKAKNNF